MPGVRRLPICLALGLLWLVACIAHAQEERAIRNDERGYTLVLPPGWSRIDPADLALINQQGAQASPPVTYVDGFVPDEQPEGAIVYALLQWDPQLLGPLAPGEIERAIRANIAQSRRDAGTASARITEPAFDWTQARVEFTSTMVVGDALLETRTVGRLGATGIAWLHGFAPPAHWPEFEGAHRALADSLRFDAAHAYVPPTAAPSSTTPSSGIPWTLAIVPVVLVTLVVAGLIIKRASTR